MIRVRRVEAARVREAPAVARRAREAGGRSDVLELLDDLSGEVFLEQFNDEFFDPAWHGNLLNFGADALSYRKRFRLSRPTASLERFVFRWSARVGADFALEIKHLHRIDGKPQQLVVIKEGRVTRFVCTKHAPSTEIKHTVRKQKKSDHMAEQVELL